MIKLYPVASTIPLAFVRTIQTGFALVLLAWLVYVLLQVGGFGRK